MESAFPRPHSTTSSAENRLIISTAHVPRIASERHKTTAATVIPGSPPTPTCSARLCVVKVRAREKIESASGRRANTGITLPAPNESLTNKGGVTKRGSSRGSPPPGEHRVNLLNPHADALLGTPEPLRAHDWKGEWPFPHPDVPRPFRVTAPGRELIAEYRPDAFELWKCREFVVPVTGGTSRRWRQKPYPKNRTRPIAPDTHPYPDTL
ncbi:unnamed protein product [Gemmata massiliana]|uniref:Uncharacterized protein n=1 Tax=Gemmata massiliana TaxID=1210884 RepID=A0A6P2DG74_9BACT|nr:unnamed protein product [Gemmata massiliana]